MTARSFEEWMSEARANSEFALYTMDDDLRKAWTASRAALLADRPDVAGAIAAINAAVCGDFLRHADQQAIADKFTPCEPKCECAGLLRARSALEALAAQLAELEAELAKVKVLAEAFPRATSQPIGTNDWVIDVSFLKRVKSAHRKLFPDCADPYPDLETIEEVLLALEAARAAYPKDAP